MVTMVAFGTFAELAAHQTDRANLVCPLFASENDYGGLIARGAILICRSVAKVFGGDEYLLIAANAGRLRLYRRKWPPASRPRLHKATAFV
jgi:hypothetical protein